jgi:hypothetical protein
MILRILSFVIIVLVCSSDAIVLAGSPQREKPVITSAAANAPRALTVAWSHTDTGVYGYMIQFKDQNGWRDVQSFDHTFTQATLVFLEPNTDYTLRVCGVYGPDRDGDFECSDSQPTVRTLQPETSSASGAAPTIVRDEVSQNTIKIWWQSQNYGFFHVRWAEKGTDETQDRINSAGNNGYHEVNNLRSGVTYTFRMQGCNTTLLGSSCGSWGAPIEIRTAFPPLETPGLSVLPPYSAQGIKLGWSGGVDFTNTNILLYRDGKVVHDARASTGMNNPHIDFVPRPNTDYSYRICFVREEWKCSDTVSAAGKPIAPTAPVLESAEVFRPQGPILRGQLPPVRLNVKWRNTEIPGRYVVVERLEFRTRGRGFSGPPIIEWAELTKVDSKSNPVEAAADLVGGSRMVNYPQNREFRICSVVPALGATGKVCTPKFSR